MRSNIFLLELKLYLIVAFFAAVVNHQQIQAQESCSCKETFTTMTAKVEANYIGFHLMKTIIANEYEIRKSNFTKRAAEIPIENCTILLQEFLTFFGDEHLFAVEFPTYPSHDLDMFKAKISADKQDISLLKTNSDDPLTGYWTDGTNEYIIVRSKGSPESQEYTAFIVNTPNKSKIGEKKFVVKNIEIQGIHTNTIKRCNATFWDGTYYTNAYAPRYVRVSLHKDGEVLVMSGGILWARLDMQGSNSKAPLLKPDLPRVEAPNAETILLTIPTFLVEKKLFDSVLLAEATRILNAKYLIIDIRGNFGGNGIYFDLLKAYSEKTFKSKRGWAVASEDNITYFSKFTTLFGNDPYSPVVAAMKSATAGTIVQGPIFPDLALTPLPNIIQQVVIVTDRGVKSAAETFVLHSKAVSNKVITMGDNTGGVVDYNSINMVKLSCTKHGITLGYPTYTLHESIIEQGYNAEGIPPDIRIDNAVKDKIGFVLEYLQKQAKDRKK